MIMKKYLSLAALLILFSCGKKEDVLLPKSNRTVVKNMQDFSSLYFFFRKNEKDTLVEVNRKNTISTTNWIFHIDRRLPLRLVIPEIVKLQKKRVNGMHENPKAGNYFSYADSISKNLAFLPFTAVNFRMEKSKSGVELKCEKNGDWFFDNQKINEGELKQKINSFTSVNLAFDKDMPYGIYVQKKVLLEGLKISPKEEFIY